MGNGYDYHLHHHPHNHRPAFLPMLCSKPSLKEEVSLPMSRRDHHRTRTLSDDDDDDPLSPKISCIGQVKRNNKIVGLPAPVTSHHKFTIAATPGHQNFQVRYFKLRRLFSGKNLTTTANAAAARSCGKGTVSCEKGVVSDQSGSVPILIENLDPPLPVIRREPKQQGEREEREPLWKRRSGGTALGSLQIKELQLKRNNLTLPTHSKPLFDSTTCIM